MWYADSIWFPFPTTEIISHRQWSGGASRRLFVITNAQAIIGKCPWQDMESGMASWYLILLIELTHILGLEHATWSILGNQECLPTHFCARGQAPRYLFVVLKEKNVVNTWLVGQYDNGRGPFDGCFFLGFVARPLAREAPACSESYYERVA